MLMKNLTFVSSAAAMLLMFTPSAPARTAFGARRRVATFLPSSRILYPK
jgi:hypothetical protein